MVTAPHRRARVVDDQGTNGPASLRDEQPLTNERGRVYSHVADHGPLPIAGLQGDLYPYDGRQFQQVLAVLGREGVLDVAQETVDADVDPALLGDPEPASLRGSTLTLRPARGGDFRRLLDLIRSIAGDQQRGALDSVAREIVADGQLHRWDGDTGRVVYVATVDGRVRGWAHVATVPGISDDHAELAGGIAEGSREEGIGSRLLQYALDSPPTREHCRVFQQIPAGDDDAYQFLRKHGWHVESCGSNAAELRVVQDL